MEALSSVGTQEAVSKREMEVVSGETQSYSHKGPSLPKRTPARKVAGSALCPLNSALASAFLCLLLFLMVGTCQMLNVGSLSVSVFLHPFLSCEKVGLSRD